MKTLYIVRHAKSSWDYPELSDFDRPLNGRGKRDAPRMGKFLKGKNILPDLFLASPANRALTTAQKIAHEVGYHSEISTDRGMFHSGGDQLLRILREQDDQYNSIMMFGHNPGFTDFANDLANQSIDNIPTCGVCQVDFPVDNWGEVNFGGGKLIFFQFPKGL